jgi:hypothetical protein
VAEPAEVADDRRQRCRDDRLVERRQEHHQQQPAEDQRERMARARVRRRRFGSSSDAHRSPLDCIDPRSHNLPVRGRSLDEPQF